MAIFKCKMCGGNLDVLDGKSIGTCDSCGTTMTLPKSDDDKRANLYGRANHFRRNNEFDRAMGIYEQILNEDRTDAEAYWSLVLCKYGIEYVEDPDTHRQVPTCNRTQFTSIFLDEDYKQALANADGYQKGLYEEEAKAIDNIQKGILDIASKEEPFDVFVCYKETDEAGKRTPDSVLAQDLYFQLKHEGFKVFFSRITLEDKLGSAYEPYIFAALNSSKVMVLVGTKPAFITAVWVKNEWSRYLSLIKKGAKKTLIPAYKDMDPYDLPEEFSHLQAQDMGKLGFMQDLIRGVKKIISGSIIEGTQENLTSINPIADTVPLLRRAFICLEGGNWKKADELLEQVLNINPESPRAYVGKLMVHYKINNEALISSSNMPIDELDDYKNAIRFAEPEYRTELENYNRLILDRIESSQRESEYQKAKGLMTTINTCDGYKRAANLFRNLGDFRDAPMLANQCAQTAAKLYSVAEAEKEQARLLEEKSVRESKKGFWIAAATLVGVISFALMALRSR